MRSLRLFAIAIDDVRDLFRASPELAERLRATAARRFPPAPPPRKVGLFRREPALIVDPRLPNRADVDAVLTGAYVAPERLPQAWRLVTAWLEDLATAHQSLELDGLDHVEFDLARAGLPSDYALAKLAGRDLGVPLRPLPGHLAGYAKHVQAEETGQALQRVADDAGPEFSDLLARLAPVREVLAAVAADPHLDLVILEDGEAVPTGT